MAMPTSSRASAGASLMPSPTNTILPFPVFSSIMDSIKPTLLAGSENVIVIDKEMDKQEVNSLIKCCDVLISLHRSEGFGLVLAEAMYLGVPVIATNCICRDDLTPRVGES